MGFFDFLFKKKTPLPSPEPRPRATAETVRLVRKNPSSSQRQTVTSKSRPLTAVNPNTESYRQAAPVTQQSGSSTYITTESGRKVPAASDSRRVVYESQRVVPRAATPATTEVASSNQSVRTAVRSKQLGQLLIKNAVLDEATLEDALAEQRRTGELLGKILMKKGVADDSTIAKVLGQQITVTTVNLTTLMPDHKALKTLPVDFCETERLVPFEVIHNTLCIAMVNPLDGEAKNKVKERVNMKIKVFDASSVQIKDAIKRWYT